MQIITRKADKLRSKTSTEDPTPIKVYTLMEVTWLPVKSMLKIASYLITVFILEQNSTGFGVQLPDKSQNDKICTSSEGVAF